jgi:hypothetical protein
MKSQTNSPEIPQDEITDLTKQEKLKQTRSKENDAVQDELLPDLSGQEGSVVSNRVGVDEQARPLPSR